MKLGEYIKALQKIAEEHGNALECVYSRDDEGNGFEGVHYAPSAGHYNGDWEFDNGSSKPTNAVCLN